MFAEESIIANKFTRMTKKLLWILLLVAGLGVRTVSAQQFAARSNLLYWMTGTINFGGEYAVSKHSSVGLSFNLNPWTFGTDKKIRHWFVRPEYRYWFTERYTRLFIGVHLIGGKFEVGGFELPAVGDRFMTGLPDNYYKGSVVGAGLTLGYDFYVSPHWNIELSAGVGVGRLKYHTEAIRGGAATADRTRILPIPTELGVNFVYLFNSKK